MTEIREKSVVIDTYGEINEGDLEYIVFPGIRMLYLYLNADGIDIFKLDGSVINKSFIAGFTEGFPDNIKESIKQQID